jgi:hypothetical protein
MQWICWRYMPFGLHYDGPMDAGEVAQACATAEGRNRTGCFLGFGRALQPREDEPGHCVTHELATPDRLVCTYGMYVGWFAMNRISPEQAIAACDDEPRSIEDGCAAAIGRWSGMREGRGWDDPCERLTTRLRATCRDARAELGGAAFDGDERELRFVAGLAAGDRVTRT